MCLLAAACTILWLVQPGFQLLGLRWKVFCAGIRVCRECSMAGRKEWFSFWDANLARMTSRCKSFCCCVFPIAKLLSVFWATGLQAVNGSVPLLTVLAMPYMARVKLRKLNGSCVSDVLVRTIVISLKWRSCAKCLWKKRECVYHNCQHLVSYTLQQSACTI